MNYLQKKILIITAAIGNVAMSLSAAAIATYAWFQQNIKVAADSLTVACEEPSDKLEYKIFKYKDDIKAGYGYTSPSEFTLPDYDTFIPEKNVYANVIIRAVVTVPAFETKDYSFKIDLTRLSSTFLNNGKIGNVTSNVIQLKSTIYAFKEVGKDSFTPNTSSHNSIDESSDASIYSTASAYFASRSTPTTFVPIRYADDGSAIVNRGDEEAKRTISLVPDLPDGFEISKVVMYLECSYHDTLVNEYLRTNQSGDATKNALNGDISKITFSKKLKKPQTSLATGKYIKVESLAALSNGQYLHSYETDSSTGEGKILKGSLATSNKAASTDSGIYIDGNAEDVSINTNPGNEPKSIDSTDTIDENSFDFIKTNNTFKSKKGQYIGNNTASNGIATNSTLTSGYYHTIGFANNHANVNAYGNDGSYNMRMRYYSNLNKFYYYNGTGEQTDLFRYTENVAEMPVLSSIAITSPASKTAFFIGEKFSVAGLVVTATYTNGSTANVTGSCTFTSSTDPKTLVPNGKTGSTTFDVTEPSKEVYVNYSEGGVTIADANKPHYTISVSKDDLSSISVTSLPTKIYYYVGDTFSSNGLRVKAIFASGREVSDITPTSISTPDMSSSGTKSVTVSYEVDGVNKTTSFNIYVRARALSINPTTKSLAEGSTFNITVTHNQDVSIAESTADTGDVSLSTTSISYSKSDKTTTTTTVVVTAVTAGTVTLTFSSDGVANVTCSITITQSPADSFVIGAGEIVSSTDYTSYENTVSKDYSGSGAEDRDWLVTFGGNSSSVGTNSGHYSSCNLSSYPQYAVSPITTSDVATAFASTSKLNKIKNISFTHTGGKNNTKTIVYALYSSDGTSFSLLNLATGSFSQGGTMSAASTDYTFVFNQAYTGYFALVFKSTLGSSGDWRIDGLSVTYNKKILDHITLTGDCTYKTYNNGASLNTAGLIVTATYSDDTTEDVTASATLTPATNPLTTGTTSVVVNASYTLNGITKSASKTITGLVVNSVKVSSITLSATTATISVGSTTTLTVTAIAPANADNKTYTWSIYSGASYATVDSSGVVTGTAAGTAKIRATANDGGGAYGECTVTVTSSVVYYSVTYKANGGTGSDYVVSNIESGSTHDLVAVGTAGFTAPSGKQFKCWSINSTERSVGYGVTVTSNITVNAVWEDKPSTTSTYTFTSNSWGDSTSSWNSGKAGNALTSGRGIQVTAKTTGANATTKSSFTSVTKVVVTYSTNASTGAGSIAIKIGSNSAVSQSVTKTGGTTDRTLTFNFSPAQTGTVNITVTCTTNSIYVKSVAITHG